MASAVIHKPVPQHSPIPLVCRGKGQDCCYKPRSRVTDAKTGTRSHSRCSKGKPRVFAIHHQQRRLPEWECFFFTLALNPLP